MRLVRRNKSKVASIPAHRATISTRATPDDHSENIIDQRALNASWPLNKARGNMSMEYSRLATQKIGEAYREVQRRPDWSEQPARRGEEGLGQAFVPFRCGERRECRSDESCAKASGEEPDQREHRAHWAFSIAVPRVVEHHLLLLIYGREGNYNYTLPSDRCSAEVAWGYLKHFRAFPGRFGAVRFIRLGQDFTGAVFYPPADSPGASDGASLGR